jgi:TRAP-type transport system small permease protein
MALVSPVAYADRSVVLNESPRGRSVPVRLIEVLCVLLLLLLLGLVSLQVVMRYVFSAPLVWSEELARMVFVYLTFVGAGLAFLRGENLRLLLLPDVLTRRARLGLRAAIATAEIGFIVVVIAYSVPLLRRLYPAHTPALEWSMAAFYAGVLVGGAVIVVAAAVDLGRTLAALGRERGRP